MSLNRRTFGCLALATASVQFSRSAAAQPIPSGQKSPEDWISSAFEALGNKGLLQPKGGKVLGGQLIVFKFKDPVYAIHGPISWRPPSAGPNSDMKPVHVPKGFVTDFASIPRVFWSAVRPDGDYAFAAVIHDYVYWAQDRSRSDADRIFKFAMNDLKIPLIVAEPLFRAVDLGGKSAWEANAKLKAAGERRVLSKLPEEAATTWAVWKRRSGVFAD